MDYLQSFKDMISLRGLADNTFKSYCTYIKSYLDYIENVLQKSPDTVSYEEQKAFLAFLKADRKLADRTINAAIAQIRFFTIYVLHKPWDPTQLPSRRFESFLPFVPSKTDTLFFIESMPDLKAKAMLALLYSSGLRHCEVRNLRYEDVSRKNMRIHITHSKNRCDRYAILSTYALEILTHYWHMYGKPRKYLFHAKYNQDMPINYNFLPENIAELERRLGWEKRLTCHSFRHAFGTHLYESGADLLTIKSYLGHKSLSSTEIYVHLAVNPNPKFKSPFDLR